MQFNVWQATWCIVFGFWTFQSVQRITTGSLDCFIRFGAYEVCDNTSYLSVYSNLFLLMAQALISRVFTPGMSNFVNASVRNLMLANRLVLHNPTQILNSDSGSRRKAHDCNQISVL